jgi:hypothetical protein
MAASRAGSDANDGDRAARRHVAIKTPRAVEVSNLTRRGDASPTPAQSGTVPGVIPAVAARARRKSQKLHYDNGF